MVRIVIASRDRLQRALNHVVAELADHGFWTRELRQVSVHLAPVGYALGWYRGRIVIPTLSGSRLVERFLRGFPYTPLRDVIRHEYGHGLADLHPGQLRKLGFKSIFTSGDYDPARFVSAYATVNPEEDFCESLALFLKHNGHPPRDFTRQVVIRRKFSFVRRLGRALRNR